MAPQRRCWTSIGADRVRVEVMHEAREPLLGQVIALRVGRGHVPNDKIARIDGGHTVALAHQPGSRDAGEGVGRQIPDIREGHVKRSPGMPLRLGFEIYGL